MEFFSADLVSECISKLLGEAARNEFLHTLAVFAIAALLHAMQVRKEIRAQFEAITKAINDVAAALRADMKVQSERVSLVERTVDKIDSRLTKLEGE